MRELIGKMQRKARYSFVGLWISFKEEKSLWVLLVMSIILISLGFWLRLSIVEWAITILTLFLSIIIEVINTAVEATVDTISFQYNVKVKKIKDIASAATLLMTLVTITIISLIFVTKIIEVINK